VVLSVAGSALVVEIYDAGHDQALTGLQVAGGLLVVVAVMWVQTHPPAPEVEAVPAWGVERPSKAS
jgi:hypothetical protein